MRTYDSSYNEWVWCYQLPLITQSDAFPDFFPWLSSLGKVSVTVKVMHTYIYVCGNRRQSSSITVWSVFVRLTPCVIMRKNMPNVSRQWNKVVQLHTRNNMVYQKTIWYDHTSYYSDWKLASFHEANFIFSPLSKKSDPTWFVLLQTNESPITCDISVLNNQPTNQSPGNAYIPTNFVWRGRE